MGRVVNVEDVVMGPVQMRNLTTPKQFVACMPLGHCVMNMCAIVRRLVRLGRGIHLFFEFSSTALAPPSLPDPSSTREL